MIRRLFFALEFPADIRLQIARSAQELIELAGRGRWTPADNLHLTLQFLGDCPDERLPDLSSIISTAAGAFPPFVIQISGAGTFGRDSDILWLGVQPQPVLTRLALQLDVLLRSSGFPGEKRPFSPHITIGRQVRIGAEQLAGWSMSPLACPIDKLSLMESTTFQNRLVYRPVLCEPLRGPDTDG